MILLIIIVLHDPFNLYPLHPFFWFVSETKDLGFFFAKKKGWGGLIGVRQGKIVIFQAEICWVFLLAGISGYKLRGTQKEKAGVLFTL